MICNIVNNTNHRIKNHYYRFITTNAIGTKRRRTIAAKRAIAAKLDESIVDTRASGIAYVAQRTAVLAVVGETNI
jgi:hypothetical protein